MRETSIGVRVFLVLVLAALIPAAAFAGGQTSPSVPVPFARQHSVAVIGPNSPMFDTLLERWFPGVTSVKYFSQLKPLLAIMHNNTKRVVKAYVVKWTITNADGSTSTAMLPVVQEPEAQWVLSGQRTVIGPAGTGTGTQLISPFFHWNRKRFPTLLTAGAVAGTFAALSQQQPVVKQASAAASVRAVLDGAVFGDGVFIGPDTSLLYERLQAAQQAEKDEGAWLSQQLAGGLTTEQIKGALSEQIYQGRNAVASGASALYTAARGREAERLMGILDRRGIPALSAVIGQIAVAPRLALAKQGAP